MKALHDYDEHMVKGWKEDVDSLLVFVSFIPYTILNRRSQLMSHQQGWFILGSSNHIQY